MHREELVVLLRRQKVLIWPRQLQAHDESFDAAEQEKNKRRHDVSDADRLVIDGREPAAEPGADSQMRSNFSASEGVASTVGIAVISAMRRFPSAA